MRRGTDRVSFNLTKVFNVFFFVRFLYSKDNRNEKCEHFFACPVETIIIVKCFYIIILRHCFYYCALLASLLLLCSR